jgi:hypothetical protein
LIEIKRQTVNNGCSKCSKQEIILILVNNFLKLEYLQAFIDIGYRDNKNYTNSGIFYIEDNDLIAMGPIGSNRLQIKCKNSNCINGLDKFEMFLKDFDGASTE